MATGIIQAVEKFRVFGDGTDGYIAWKYGRIAIVKISRMYLSETSSSWKEICVLPDDFRPKANADTVLVNNAGSTPATIVTQGRIYSSGSVLIYLFANTSLSVLGNFCYITKY